MRVTIEFRELRFEGELRVARKSSSSRWSRPATGKQIAALKAHANYDGKYYSMGRASQAMGGPKSGGSSPGRSSAGAEGYYPSRFSPGYSPATFLSQLLGVPDDLDSLLLTALGQGNPGSAMRHDAQAMIESVAFSVAPDESDPVERRIVFDAKVVRDPSFTGTISFDVRFVSNVEFGQVPPSPPQGFTSGVAFDD